MEPPGAPISGLRVRSGARPYELKEEIKPPVGLTAETVSVVQVMVTGPAAMRLRRVLPSAWRMATVGTVMAGQVGKSAFGQGIGVKDAPPDGSTVGLSCPAVLLAMITAAAPASCANRAFQ